MFLHNVLGNARWGAVNKHQSHCFVDFGRSWEVQPSPQKAVVPSILLYHSNLREHLSQICYQNNFPGRSTLAASAVTPQFVGLAAPFVDVSPVAACGRENVLTEGFNCDNFMTAWSCGWFCGTLPSIGYVPSSLIMSTIQLHVLFWGTESTNPVSPPITIVNSHLISFHTKHSTLAPESAWVSLRAFFFGLLPRTSPIFFNLTWFSFGQDSLWYFHSQKPSPGLDSRFPATHLDR